VLDIELLNTSFYDRLFVTGHANLDGTLNVILLPGYSLHNGDRFTILNFESVSGDFANWNLPSRGQMRWEIYRTEKAVELEYVATPEASAWTLVVFGVACLLWLMRSVRRRAHVQTAKISQTPALRSDKVSRGPVFRECPGDL